MSPLHVLHVMSRLPIGGVERQLAAVLRNYDRQKITPSVCSLSDKGTIGIEIEKMGIEVVSLGRLRHGFSPALVGGLMQVMKDRKIDVVRTHQYHANLYGRIAALLCGIPCIVPSIHNVYIRDRKIHRRILNNLLGRLSDRIIAVSGAVKDDVMRYDRIPDKDIMVIHNGVDETRFVGGVGAAIRSEFHIPDNTAIVGTIGRLTSQKGHRYLIEAAASVMIEFPDLVLLIVGEGPDSAALKSLVSQKCIEQRVIFTGSRNDVPDLLAAMDIFVFPSLWEGLPNALVEAMTAGKAIIASDIRPNREVLGSADAGMVVPCNDSASIASALAALLRDRGLAERLGAVARERALSLFTIAETVRNYTTLFEEVLEKKAGRADNKEKVMRRKER